MGCGIKDYHDRMDEEKNKELIEGFKAIASNDAEIIRFMDKLEDINRQLYNFRGCDVALKHSNYLQISSALNQVEELQRKIRHAGLELTKKTPELKERHRY